MQELNHAKSKISSFTDLVTWQEAHKLVLEVYKITQLIPNKEKYNVISQLERAAVSITNNIAEGFGRQSSKEMTQFLYIALGSLKEVQNMTIICRDMNYITEDQFSSITTQTASTNRLLRGLIKSNKLKHA
jgi:four helix bundle protein